MEMPDKIERHQAGWERFQEGRILEACQYFERVLAKEPGDHEARYWLGLILLTADELERAKSEARRIITDKPDWWRGWVLRAKVLVRAKQAALAVESSDKAVQLAPNEADAWVQRSELFDQLRLWRDALFAAQCAVDADDKRADAWLKMGVATAALGRWEEAHEYVKKAAELRPEVEYYQDKLASSENDLRKLRHSRSRTPTDAAGWLELGEELPDPEESLACFRKAVELDPVSPGAWLACARQCLKMRRFKAAGEAIARLKLASETEFQNIAGTLIGHGFDEKGQALEGVTQQAADEAAGLALDAEELLRVAVPRDPLWERAWKLCEDALALNPACRYALWIMVNIRAGRRDELLDAAKRCHSRFPGYWNVSVIVRRMLELGKIDEALEYARPYADMEETWEEEASPYEGDRTLFDEFRRRLLGRS